MTPKNPPPTPKLLIAVLAFAWFAFASAQVDERARVLLDGLRPPAGETVETLQQVTVMVLHGQDDFEVRTRSVFDYVNERAAIETEIAPGMAGTVIVADGQVRMVMGGFSVPLPGAVADAFADVFDVDPADPYGEGTVATYDGVQSYGGVLEGEQVTVRGAGAGAIAGVEADDESRLIFDGAGRLLGVVVDSDDGQMAIVFATPVRGSTVVGNDATMYLLRAGGPERFATMRFEDVRVNEPIPEGIF